MSVEPSTRIDAALQSMPPAVDLLVALLKAAREATDDVPIVKQILGAAVHIIEYAEKMRANRDAMRSLAEKAATFAQQIQQIVEGCVVNDRLQARLQRLHTVFDDIESFARAESAVQGRFKRTLRTCFIVPRQIERLRGDLDNGIQAFLLTTTLEMTLRQEDEAEYVGGLRRLRQCDVHTLEILHTLHHRGATIQYSKSRVKGEVILVRHVKRNEGRSVASDGVDAPAAENETIAPDSDNRLIDLLTNAPLPHPNVVQFVGRSRSTGPVFTSLRCGSHSVWDFWNYVLTLPDGELRQCGVADIFNIIFQVIDAAAYLERDLNIIWYTSLSEGLELDDVVIDCSGRPSIGFVEHLTQDHDRCEDSYVDLFCRIVDDLARVLFKSPRHCFVGTIANYDHHDWLLYALQYPNSSPAWNTAVSRLLEERLSIESWVILAPRFVSFQPMFSERTMEYIDQAMHTFDRALWEPSIELVCGPYPNLPLHWTASLWMEHVIRKSENETSDKLKIRVHYRSDDSIGRDFHQIQIPEHLREEFRAAVYGTDPVPMPAVGVRQTMTILDVVWSD